MRQKQRERQLPDVIADGANSPVPTGDLSIVSGSGLATDVFSLPRRKPLQRISRLVDILCTTIMCVVLLAICFIIVTTVVMRAAHLGSLIWADTATELGLAILAFLGAVSAFLRDEHVGLKGLQARFGPRVNAEIRGGVALVSLCFAVFLAVLGTQFVFEPNLGLFPATGWPTSLLYVPFALGGIMLSIVAIIRLIESGWRKFPWFAAGIIVVIGFVIWFFSRDGGLYVSNAPTVALIITVVALAIMIVIGTPIAMALGLATVVGVQLAGFPMKQIPLQMTGHVITITLISLPLFVLVGVLYGDQRVAERLTAVIERASSRIPGGEGIAAVISMFVFSGLSGSKLADVAAVAPAFVGRDNRLDGVAATQVEEVPLEQRADMSGILSASAVMGETIPPSVVMVVLTSVTTISTGALFVAGLIPAVVVGVCIIAAVILWQLRRRRRLGAAAASTRSSAGKDEPIWLLLVRALPALLGVVIIAGGIIFGIATPSEASAVAALYSLILVIVLFRPKPRVLIDSLAKTARLSAMLLFMVASAGALTWFLTTSGISQYVSDLSTALHGSVPLFLIAFIIILVILGSALEGIPAIIMLAPILIPQATDLGISDLQAGILFLLSLGVGIFLPPLGNGFYTSSVVTRVTPKEALAPTLRYMTAVVIGILLVAFIPAISTWLPKVLLGSVG